ncbi:hypothetical protein LIANG_03040 [Enterococcus durans]|nr:hypothetical protein LIANG_03040 [Enterococcus durans]
MNPPMNLLAKLILKDFRVSFLYFFIQKKMLAKFTNIKKYRAVFCIARFFFEISEKTGFWTPFIRESVANLIFRFVAYFFLSKY